MRTGTENTAGTHKCKGRAVLHHRNTSLHNTVLQCFTNDLWTPPEVGGTWLSHIPGHPRPTLLPSWATSRSPDACHLAAASLGRGGRRATVGRVDQPPSPQETSTSTLRQLGTSAPCTRRAIPRARPPDIIQGASHAEISGGRCPTGSPEVRCTQTSGSSCPGGSGIRTTGSPSSSVSSSRSRPPKTVPCTVDLKRAGRPGGSSGSGRFMGTGGGEGG